MLTFTNASIEYLDPPSFDLGIEFQTQDKYMAAKRMLVDPQHVEPPTKKQVVEVEMQPAGGGANVGDIGFECSTLTQTPAFAKRKSSEMTWTSPDNMFKCSTTSPASMSKILADGAVFATIVRSEEGLDMNIQPWDHDTTDSLVLKKTVGNDRLAKSPWFHGFTHKLCPIEKVAVIMDQLMSGIGHSELERYMML
jgi:hypothetical protein